MALLLALAGSRWEGVDECLTAGWMSAGIPGDYPGKHFSNDERLKLFTRLLDTAASQSHVQTRLPAPFCTLQNASVVGAAQHAVV
eukprot:1068234-Rhodomonas_salina.1